MFRQSLINSHTRRMGKLLSLVALSIVFVTVPESRGAGVLLIYMVLVAQHLTAWLRRAALAEGAAACCPADTHSVPYEVWRNRHRSTMGRATYRASL